MTLEGKRARHVLFAALMCLPIVFLFARLPPTGGPGNCLTRVSIGSAVNLVHVCDSDTLTAQLRNLERYFTTLNEYRSRPVYIVGGAVLAAALSPVAVLIRATVLNRHIGGSVDTATFLRRFPDYFALWVANVLILAATLWIAIHLIGWRDGELAVALGAAIVTSDLIHGYFWSQHPAFMNVIVPLGCIAFFVVGCRARQMTTAAIAGFGFVAAFSMLIYGFAVIWLPAFVFGALYRDWRMGARTADIAAGLPRVVVTLAITGCGPVLVWIAVNAFYLHMPAFYEAAGFRQFAWLADAWHDGALGAALVEHWHGYLAQVWAWLGWPAPASLLGIAVLVVLGRRERSPMQIVCDPIVIAAALAVASILIFNFFQGYNQPRLVNGIVLALFVALGRVGQQTGRANLAAGVLLAICIGQIAGAFMEPAITVS